MIRARNNHRAGKLEFKIDSSMSSASGSKLGLCLVSDSDSVFGLSDGTGLGLGLGLVSHIKIQMYLRQTANGVYKMIGHESV